MLVRDAALRDAEAIARHNVLLANESEDERIIFKSTLAAVKAVLADRRKGFYLVAEEGGAAIGQLMLTFEWSDWRNRMMWWIQSVYVDKEWRGKGVFRKLLAEVRRRARKEGVRILRLYVHTGNRKGIKAYEGAGMDRKPYYIYQFDVSP